MEKNELDNHEKEKALQQEKINNKINSLKSLYEKKDTYTNTNRIRNNSSNSNNSITFSKTSLVNEKITIYQNQLQECKIIYNPQFILFFKSIFTLYLFFL